MAFLKKDGDADSFTNSIPVGPLGLVTLEGCVELTSKVNDYLIQWRDQNDEAIPNKEFLYTVPGYKKDSFILDSKRPRFSNGEGKAVFTESIRGYDVFIFCDVGNYSCRYKMYDMMVPMSPDDHYQDLKRTIAAIGGKARRISVVMPMLYEGRQHRRTMRESLDCAVMLQELAAMGVSNIITFDAHDPKIQNAVPLIGFETIRPTYQMLKALFRAEKDIRIDSNHTMVVSPDEGAIDRNIYYCTMLGLDLGIFYKRRDYTNVVNGRNPIIAHEYVGNSVEGKDVIIADDMIASGDSMLDIAYELKKRHARNIYILATFGLFTDGLDKFRKAYADGVFTRVLCTNLTYRNPELYEQPWFVEVDISKYLSYIVATINHDASLNALLNPYVKIKNLLSRYRAEQKELGIEY